MSFGRRQPSHKQQPSLKSLQQRSQQSETSQLAEKYGKRLTSVEHNLNAICSQHDALMPLLTLLDSMPHLSKSDQQIRNILKKAGEIDSKLDRLDQSYRQSRGKEGLEGVEQSFSSVSRSLQDCKQSIHQMELVHSQQIHASTSKHSSIVAPLTEEIDRRIDSSKKEIQLTLAQFKNQIELQYKKHLQTIKSAKLSPEDYSKTFPEPPFSQLQDQLKNLYREIAMVRVEIPRSDLMEFHNYNFSRIGYELYEIEEIVSGMYSQQHHPGSITQSLERVEWLGYQIRGLRKKYLRELNELASKRPIETEQQQLSHDLDSLEKRREGLLFKIQSLRNGSLASSRMKQDID